uniref:Semaphorin 7A (John Milton Hagen blood group) n=1 Tax=Cyanoderma ruficeps TaxID=181631 RepID=A0A8C3QY14_9PASS
MGKGGFGLKGEQRDGEGRKIWVEGAACAPHDLPPGEEMRENAGGLWEAVRCRGRHSRLLFPLQEDSRNYLTLVERYGDGLLVCGTGACAPTCWNVTQRKESLPWDGRGIAPFTPDSNTLVVVDGQDIYSTIKKSQQNGKIPRFRRVRGGGELYTSDTVMQNPQFVKATTLRHEEPHQDKIYYFFREDNPDKSPEAPRNISRVAQLCKEDKGGTSSLSASKWTTFLKATLICVDPVTKGNFNWLQDVFFVPADDWRRSKVYGLFTNTWGSSAVCVYSFGDIDSVFRTSRLKGYGGPTPEVKPGQCVPSGQHTPSETFKIADSHPEVEERVEPLSPSRSPLFHNKHRYQKIGVHEVAAAGGQRYNVLYLATDKGTIHKVVELPDGVQNIMEIQVFPNKDPIQSMILDHTRAVLYVGSGSRVLELPMAMCGAYRNNCHSCVLARDPYCGWANGSCLSLALSRCVGPSPKHPHPQRSPPGAWAGVGLGWRRWSPKFGVLCADP